MKTEELLNLLRSKGLTLSCMESITGGLLSATFTSVPGASEIFKGGIVSYTSDAKIKSGVKASVIADNGAISDKCAKEMAIAAANFLNTEVAVSLTGNAGPIAQEDKPVGLVFCAIKIYNKVSIFKMQLNGERDAIRKMSVEFALSALYKKLMELDDAE